MSLATTADLLARARSAGVGLPAFNVITLEHAEAIALGAERAGGPAILQISENAVKFHGGQLGPITAATVAVAQQAEVELSVHIDHVEDANLLRQAAGTGVSSAMFDASRLDYAGNVTATRDAVTWAHDNGMLLEAELGEVGGKDGAHAPGVRTDPTEAVDFVAATGVDALAVAVGSSHAMLERTATLDLDLIAALARELPVPLVLHGSSGVPDGTLAEAVGAGMVKINIGTILNVAFTEAVRETLAGDADLVDPRRYVKPAREAVADVVARLVGVIGSPR
ncbi:MAG: class II fructose-bisphosphate aldolase [Ornithinimicrobium sp.]